MLSWLARLVISHNMARLRAGDPAPSLRLEAEDITMRFPGNSSWSGELRGKSEHERWLRRFVGAGIQIFPDEVIAKGFPSRMTVCVRGHVHLKAPDGETVYDNRYVIWARMAWGRVQEYEVYEDTEKPNALDEWLAVHEPAALVS